MKVVLVTLFFGLATTLGLKYLTTTPSSVKDVTLVENSSATTVKALPVDTSSTSTTTTSNSKVILNLHLNPARVIEINEAIGGSIQDNINRLRDLEKASKEPVYILLNSPGGSVLDGALLISQMEAMKAPVYTVCTKMCASMAAIIHQHGRKRYMVDHSILMFHPASGATSGQINNMVSLLSTITKYIEKMNNTIISRSKVSKEDFDRLTAYELWIDAEDSYTKGFSDGTVSLDFSSGSAHDPFSSEHYKHSFNFEMSL